MDHTGFTGSSVDGAPWIVLIYCFYVDHLKSLYCNLLQYCCSFLDYSFTYFSHAGSLVLYMGSLCLRRVGGGATSHCSAPASHCGGFSSCGAWALGRLGFRGCGAQA